MKGYSKILKEYDFLEHKGNIFRVLGNIRPRDKYVVSIRWHFDQNACKYVKVTKYGTILQDPDVLSLYGTVLQKIPWYGIKAGVYEPKKTDRIFFPDRFFSRLDAKNADFLTQCSLDFKRYLQNVVGIPEDHIGVGGSLLLGFHSPSSDVDFIVYDYVSCRKLVDRFDDENELESEGYKLVDWDKSLMAKSFYTRISSPTSVHKHSCYLRKKALKGRLHFSVEDRSGTKIDIHYVRWKNPMHISPPEILAQSEVSEYKAIVVDTENSHFYPGAIKIAEIEDFHSGQTYRESYLLFIDKRFHFLKKNDAISFRGRLLRIVPQENFLFSAKKYIIGNELLSCILGDSV